MLEIRKKQMVTTRKKHECYGCLEEIEKGKSAVYVSAKEDERRIQYHLHEECNKIIAKDQWFAGSGLYRGCIKEAVKNSEELKIINISSLDELPLVLGLQRS